MLRKTMLAHALTIAFAASSVSLALVGSAHAASNSAGDIVGRAAAGTVITIENKSIGFTRSLTVGQNGDYQLTMLPPGSYVVRAKRADGAVEERQVSVTAGEGVSANFEAAGTSTVVVTGRLQRIDVKSPESSMVLNEAAIDRIPVARDVTAVALLAPGATRGDPRIGSTTLRAGNVPSLGGASPAENVYYINGFNVTNMLNGVAFNQVPFEAISQQQVKTGGYGPEYGRSLGGVLSVTTKRGTNEWKGGANVIWSPADARAREVYAERGASSGNWVTSERPGGLDDLQANLWLGGPVVEDKLFVFGLVQGADIEQNTFGSSVQTQYKTSTPRYLLKADWNITDKNLLELTAFSDKSKDKVRTWNLERPYSDTPTTEKLPDEYTTGGENYIAKYTSWLTDSFTISALAGLGRYNNGQVIGSAACPYITDNRTGTTRLLGCATAASTSLSDAMDERKAYRIDAEWNLGDHGLRFGLDNDEYKVVSGSISSGGAREYIRTAAPGATLSNGYTNTGAAFDYVESRHFENGGAFTTKNAAYYIEDNWQVSKNLMLNLGVRNESFENLNADDKTFIKVTNTWAPRLGLSWDVKGDQSMKLYANAGRYYIPVMSNTNVRLSGAELDYTDFYRYTGTNSADAFQRPGRGEQLGTRVVSSNGEAGDPRSVVDPNIKPMYQDEFIVGFQQALANRWSVGAKVTHRKLQSVMDDMCNGAGAQGWALANGFNASQAAIIGEAINHCFLYNPGGDLTANIDLEDGKGLTPIKIPAASLGFEKPVRKWTAVEFTFERAWDGKWNLQGSYVWAKSRGNTEGYVKSDIGQDDAGISQDWDFPGLMEGAYGFLPNDRRHTLKLFGAYQLTPELRIGANVILQSGRPLNCLGYYAGNLDEASIEYKSASFWCNRKLNPRGTMGRLPWTRELGLQASYQPEWFKGSTFTVDVLNVLNARAVAQVEEAGEASLGTPSPTYLQPGAFQPGRSIRFMAQYEF